MKLYLTPNACSLAVDIVARELGRPLPLVWVDVRAKRLPDGGDYLAVNPKGQVPALELDDGAVLTEGSVIVQLIADRHPGNTIMPPAGTMARYRVLEWLSFIGSDLHKGFTPLFRPTTPPEYRAIAVETLGRHFARLDGLLATRPYLTGDTFTAADAYCYTIAMWSHLHKLDLSGWPNLVAYLDRVGSRDSVVAARAAEAAEVRRRAG